MIARIMVAVVGDGRIMVRYYQVLDSHWFEESFEFIQRRIDKRLREREREREREVALLLEFGLL